MFSRASLRIAIATALGPRVDPRTVQRAVRAQAASPDARRPDHRRPVASGLSRPVRIAADRRPRAAPAAGRVLHECDARSGTTETAPGHATLWSGRFPSHTGIVRNEVGVARSADATAVRSRPRRVALSAFAGPRSSTGCVRADPASRALSVSRARIAGRSCRWVVRGRACSGIRSTGASPPAVTTATRSRPGCSVQRHELHARSTSAPTGTCCSPIPRTPRRTRSTMGAPGKGLRVSASPCRRPAKRDDSRSPNSRGWTTSRWTLRWRRERARAGQGTDARRALGVAVDHRCRRTRVRSELAGTARPGAAGSIARWAGSSIRCTDAGFDAHRLCAGADHGVTSYPMNISPGTDPMRGRVDVGAGHGFGTQCAGARGVDGDALRPRRRASSSSNASELAAKGVNADSVVTAMRDCAAQAARHAAVDRPSTLAAAAAKGDVIARRWLHSIPADMTRCSTITVKPYYYWAALRDATHGTPHELDARIPISSWDRCSSRAGTACPVRSVDIAPDPGRGHGVKPIEPIDGRVLPEAMQERRQRTAQAATMSRDETELPAPLRSRVRRDPIRPGADAQPARAAAHRDASDHPAEAWLRPLQVQGAARRW